MITQKEKDELIRLTREFDQRYSKLAIRAKYRPSDPEQDLFMILSTLFDNDGYILDVVMSPRHGNVDYLAIHRDSGELTGVEVKPDKKRANMGVRQLINAAHEHHFEKAILVSLEGFSLNTLLRAKQQPVNIQLLDINGIKNWVSKLEVEEELEKLSIGDVIKLTSSVFAQKIALDPDLLMNLEWRDLERMIAEVFEGLSFKVTLTPPAKDGGKDIILECESNDGCESYIVEIKHWRSLQRVGQDSVKDFLNIICKEKRKSGLFLSTYGFTDNAFEGLTEIERKKIKFGDKQKIVTLCHNYLKVKSGIWTPIDDLDHTFSEHTY